MTEYTKAVADQTIVEAIVLTYNVKWEKDAANSGMMVKMVF